MVDATDDTLTLASSSIISNRMPSISWIRYRVNIRNDRISGGGTNDGTSSPCSSNLDDPLRVTHIGLQALTSCGRRQQR